MDELGLFKKFIHKKYWIELMQYQEDIVNIMLKGIKDTNSINPLLISRGSKHNYILDHIIDFKLSLK